MNALIGDFRQARRKRDALRGRFGPGIYQRLVDDLAATILLAYEAGATASLWGLEGPLRHGIRSDLCLQGWRWGDADAMAREVLKDAFRLAGAVRPTWEEGQLEWGMEIQSLAGRTRCIRCQSLLPEGHFKFCSSNCGSGHRNHIANIKAASEDAALQMSIRSI